jgi:hypothetical protein
MERISNVTDIVRIVRNPWKLHFIQSHLELRDVNVIYQWVLCGSASVIHNETNFLPAIHIKKFVCIFSFKDAVSAGDTVRSTELLGFINNKLERL